jgi:hypothetical protein
MFTKAIFSAAFFAVLTALLGCSGESQAPSPPIVVHKSGSDCLSEMGTNLTNYFEGKMSNAEVGEFWDCTAHAVSEYERLTAGEGDRDRYKPENIMRFLEKHFLKNIHVNNDLLHSFMEVKRVVLAGRVDEVTRLELHELIDFIGVVKDVTQDLNPYARVLFFESESASDEEILEASAAMKAGLKRLGAWLDQRHQSYSYEQLETFLDQLDQLSKEQLDGAQTFRTFRKGTDALPPLKAILLAGWKQGIDGDEWAPLLDSAGDAYLAFMSFRYAFKGDLNSALVREILPQGLLAVSDILKRGAERHRGSSIPLVEWNKLFNIVEKNEWLPEDFKSAALMKTMAWLLKRPMGNGTETQSMGLRNIEALREQMENWILLRKQAVSHQPGSARLGPKYEETLIASAPLEWDGEGRMLFADQPSAQWTTESRVRMVWPFVILNWIKEGYVGRTQDQLDDTEMVTVAGELLDVLHSFGWLMDTEPKIGKKLLRESDLFTLSSNADGFIQLHEGTRYLAFVASGFRAAELWLDSAQSACGKELDAKCVRRYGADLNHGVLAAMPRLVGTLKGKPAQEFTDYMKSAEETVLDQAVVGKLGTADLLQTYIMFQYIETFVRRFDTDHSETLSLAESDPAFVHFGPILKSLLSRAGLPDEQLKAFFTFLVKYGDTPFTMMGGGVLWLHWKWHESQWQFESGRPTLMGILRQLSKL